MDDRKLLELAAKAVKASKRHVPHVSPWNPLKFHKQAVQLRHTLCLSTGFDDRFEALGLCAYATYPTGPESCDSIMQNVAATGSKNAALRRAIVRAAAAIGEAMP